MSNLEIEYVGSLFGHNGWVTSIVVGKDSDSKPLLISGSRDKKLIVWKLNLDNPETIYDKDNKPREEKIVGKPFKSLGGHSHFISGLAINKESKFVVSSSWDKTLRLWDLNTFKTRQLFVGHSKDVLAVAFSQDERMIVSGSMDKTLKNWNIKGEVKHNLDNEFNGWVSCISQFKQDKQSYFAIGSWDQSVRILDKDYKPVSRIDGFEYGVVSTATDEDGEFLFSAEKNGKIRVHNIVGSSQPELKSTIDVNADINAISFESKYYMAISCATSKGLVIHEVNKASKIIYQKDVSACHSLAWDHTKTLLFAGFADGVIRVFRFKGEQN